jgi:hypothetical protein
MRRLGFCLTLVLLSPLCLGEQHLVWVLGSYAIHDNAEKEQVRLSDKLRTAVSILETDRQLYRIIVNSNLVTREEVAGLDAWLLTMTPASFSEGSLVAQPITKAEAAEAAEVAPEETPETAPELTTRYRVSESDLIDPPLIIEEPPIEPLYPAFKPGESITQYCARLPESRLCQHPGIEQALKSDRKLLKHRDKIRNACDIVTDPEWRATCLSLHPPT